MREQRLSTSVSKSQNLHSVRSSELKNFDELIKSLKDYVDYQEKKDILCVLCIMLIALGIGIAIGHFLFPLKYPFFHDSSQDLVTPTAKILYCILLLSIMLIVLPACINELDIFYLFTTNEWNSFIKLLQYVPNLENLTGNPKIIIVFANTLINFQQQCVTQVKKNDNRSVTPTELEERATQFWRIPSWIFDNPKRQLHEAVYHKVANQLDQLFVEHQIPYDISYIITDYLIPAPKLGP